MKRFTTTYRYRDCLAANRRFLLNSWTYRWTVPFLLLLAASIFAFNFPCCVTISVAWKLALSITAKYLLVIGLLLLAYFFWSLPRTVRQKWLRDGREGDTASYVLDLRGFEVASPPLSRRFDWSDIQWWSEDQKLILMKYCATGMIYIPKEQVDADILTLVRIGLIDADVRRI